MIHSLLHILLVLWDEHRGELLALALFGLLVLAAAQWGSGGPGPPR